MGTATERLFTRPGYLAVTLAATAAGAWAAGTLGSGGRPAWAGCLAAWAVQGGSFWPLWSRVRAGRSAVRPWVAGMAVRLAGLGVLAAVHHLTALKLHGTAVAYALTLIVLLWVEGLWLARAARGGSLDTTRNR